MSSNTIQIHIIASLVSNREPPRNTTALLREDVPITTQRQLDKNLRHWREQLTAVAWVTRQLYKPRYSLTEKSEKNQRSFRLHKENQRKRTLLGHHHDRTTVEDNIQYSYLLTRTRKQENLLHKDVQQA